MYRIVNLGRYGLGQQGPSASQAPSTTPPASGSPAPASYGCHWSPSDSAQGAEGAFAVSTDPNLNCMRDARGNAICSDGSHFPPGCPHTPPPEYFSPGITPDVTTNGRIEGQIPPPKGGGGSAPAASSAAPAAAAPSSGPSPALMIGAGALGAGLLATGAYFLFLK